MGCRKFFITAFFLLFLPNLIGIRLFLELEGEVEVAFVQCFLYREVPEHLFELFDLVVREFLGTAVVEKGSGVGERTSIDLEKRGGSRP